MSKRTGSNTKKLCISGLVIALYVVTMYLTQSFASGGVQIRIATALYALSYLYPFLVLPLGIANLVSNYMFGLGALDVVGGIVVGLVTSGAVYWIRKRNLPKGLIIPVIIAGPGLIVPLWLAPITKTPYPLLALNLCAGQVIPAVAGYFLTQWLARLGLDRVN